MPAQVIVLSPAGTIETAAAAIKEEAPRTILRSRVRRRSCTRSACAAEPLSATAADPQPEGLAGAHAGFEGILGRCPAMRDVFALIQRVVR